MIKNHCQRVD